MAVQRSAPLQKVPIRHTKYAHPTYEICPSDLRKMPIRPTKNAHPTYEKCPSDLLKIEWPSDSYNYLFLPYCAICMTKAIEQVGWARRYAHPTYSCRRSDVAVGRMGSIADGQQDGWAVERINSSNFFAFSSLKYISGLKVFNVSTLLLVSNIVR